LKVPSYPEELSTDNNFQAMSSGLNRAPFQKASPKCLQEITARMKTRQASVPTLDQIQVLSAKLESYQQAIYA
jgi:hypothetical protein